MIIITGATGFIGRRVIKKLVEREGAANILCLAYNKTESELEQSGRRILEELNVRFVPVDLIHNEGMSDLPRDPEKVIHMASVTDTGEEDHRVNDVGTKNLIEALGPLSGRTRVVFTSTIALHDNRADYDSPVTEDLPLPVRPANEYGRRKLKAVNYLKEEAAKQGFSLGIIRVCGVYGSGSRKGGLFDVIDRSAKAGKLLARVPFEGKISLMHVDDMAELILSASEAPIASAKAEETIASVEALSFAQMSAIACRAHQKPYKPLPVPLFFWRCLRFFSRRKRVFEAVVPHRLYNRLWQLFLLCNNELWNESQKMRSMTPNSKLMTFEKYYSSN